MGLSINMNKSGIKAHQLARDTISNNIANATTEGYKAKGVRFNTLVANQITDEDTLLNNVNPRIAAGVLSAVAVTDFSQGSLLKTSSPLDLAIQGSAFFGVQNDAGDFYLTRDGSFTLDGTGRLVNSNGDYLAMDGAVPAGVSSADLSLTEEGGILAASPTGNIEVGRIHFYEVDSPETLQPAGRNYFIVLEGQLTRAAGVTVESNMLEMSNVDLAQELADLIVTQRAYDLNIKVSQSTDEMMSLINQFSV